MGGIAWALLLRDEPLGILQPWVNIVLHVVMPLAITLDWLIWPPRQRLRLSQTLWWLAVPIVFVVYSLIRGAIIDRPEIALPGSPVRRTDEFRVGNRSTFTYDQDRSIQEAKVRSNADTVRAMFDAYIAGDRNTADRLLAEDLVFTSPQDNHIDKTAYLEQCFPTPNRLNFQKILKAVDVDEDHVFILYEYEMTTGDRHRNTEYITVRDGRIAEIQVFFGGQV